MSFRTFDLNLLRIFDAIMTEQNLTRAAERLATTQPAVSNALKRLRETLDDELLVRTAHGMKPTARAEELWPAVRSALSALEAAIAPETFDVSETQATFRLAMADSTASLLLPRLMRAIKQEAPGLDIRMLPLTTRDPRAMLLQSDIDMAIGNFPGVVSQLSGGQTSVSAIRHQRLYSSESVCIMRKDHPLAAAELTVDSYCVGPSCAGQLLGPRAWAGRRSAGRDGAAAPHRADGQPVLHGGPRGGRHRPDLGRAAPPGGVDRRHRIAGGQGTAVRAAGGARGHAVA